MTNIQKIIDGLKTIPKFLSTREKLVNHINDFYHTIDGQIDDKEISFLLSIGLWVTIYKIENDGVCQCDYYSSSAYVCNHPPNPTCKIKTRLSIVKPSIEKLKEIHRRDKVTILFKFDQLNNYFF